MPVLPCQWPRRNDLPFGAYESAVPSARLHARMIVIEWGLPRLSELVELATSELVTNAVRTSRALPGYRWRDAWRAGTPPVWLYVWGDAQRVLVQVWDAAEEMPVKRAPQPEDEHGRGLLLVDALSTECGVYTVDGTSGKVAWALLA